MTATQLQKSISNRLGKVIEVRVIADPRECFADVIQLRYSTERANFDQQIVLRDQQRADRAIKVMLERIMNQMEFKKIDSKDVKEVYTKLLSYNESNTA